MLVVSMSDFLSDPKQYMERAQHTAVLVENAGESIKLIRTKSKFLLLLQKLFSAKYRRDERDKRDMKIINANEKRFNEDAKENLEFQADIWESK